MQMDAGLDTGALLLAQALPIAANDTTASLHDRLAALGASLMVKVLRRLPAGELMAVAQAEEGLCYARKIDKDEAWIDWSAGAQQVVRRIHAFNPAPGACSMLQGETIKIWQADLVPGTPPSGAEDGLILRANQAGIQVAAGLSAINITELQRPGGRRLPAAEFLRGFTLESRAIFRMRTRP